MTDEPTTDGANVQELADALERVKDGGVAELDGLQVGRTEASKPVRVARVNESKPIRLARARESKPIRGENLTEEAVREAVAMVDGAEAADHVQATGDGVVTYHAPATEGAAA